jgi:hypothetical protein
VNSGEVTPETFGREVLGPLVGEFCLRLWSLSAQMQRPDDAALLFCARGGLRMQMAYDRFLTASGLPSTVPAASLMVSRVVAARSTLARTVEEGSDHLLPAAATTLSYEFPSSTLFEVAVAMSGVAPRAGGSRWSQAFTPEAFAALLRHSDGQPVADALVEQAGLFERHLRTTLGGRSRAVLVDTGLFGSTAHLLTEGVSDVEFSSALIARSYRPGPPNPRTFGLSVEAEGYNPLRRRTALLRYWHFVEWLFEPDLPSVRTFTDDHGAVRSNLEVPGWSARVAPPRGHPFTGVLDYLKALPSGPAERIVPDADRAWSRFRRAVVWPDRRHGEVLMAGDRSHDFGTNATWSHRSWRGPVAALRGSTMWREGEIARSGSTLRRPLLAAIETAYGARHVKRAVTRWVHSR